MGFFLLGIFSPFSLHYIKYLVPCEGDKCPKADWEQGTRAQGWRTVSGGDLRERGGAAEKWEGGERGSQMPPLQLASWGSAQIMLFPSTR